MKKIRSHYGTPRECTMYIANKLLLYITSFIPIYLFSLGELILGELIKKMDTSTKSMSSYLIDIQAIATWYFDFRINQYISHYY